VFKLKRNEHKVVIKYKAKLVVKRYAQRRGVDYEEIFVPVARLDTIRLLIALAAHKGWEVHHLDVKSAFLNGDLHEEMFVEQPASFIREGSEQKVLKLRKALYGLHQAPRAWNTKLDDTLIAVPVTVPLCRRGLGRRPTTLFPYQLRRDIPINTPAPPFRDNLVSDCSGSASAISKSFVTGSQYGNGDDDDEVSLRDLFQRLVGLEEVLTPMSDRLASLEEIVVDQGKQQTILHMALMKMEHTLQDSDVVSIATTTVTRPRTAMTSY
jgi:hypothetical protein